MSLANLRAECEQLERDGKFRRAATQWLELSDRYEVAERWVEAEDAARHACVCAERLADEHGRKVPSLTQRRGEA